MSMPCFELFRKQPQAYRFAVLGEAPRVAIEAAVEQGWHEWLRHKDEFVGINGFGASAPAGESLQVFRPDARAHRRGCQRAGEAPSLIRLA